MPSFTPLRMRNLFDPNNQTNIPNFNPALTTPDLSPKPMVSSEPDISQRMSQLYRPQTDASNRLDTLISQYPTHENPSIMRRIGASLAGVGFGPEEGQKVLDEPFNEKLIDWKNKLQPTENAANLERYNNSNERSLAFQTISNQLKEEAQNHKEQNDTIKATISTNRAEVYRMKAEDPDYKFDFKGPHVLRTDKSGKVIDTGVPTEHMTDEDKLNLQTTNRLKEIGATGTEARKTEEVKQTGRDQANETRGWEIGTIPDPEDPTKQIGVRWNKITGETKRITFEGNKILPSKLGTNKQDQFTTSTKTMMEGANMLRPHIVELRNQAKDLENRGLFGPVMSRVRDFAAKIGTTGSPEQVEQSFNDFSNAVANDPLINSSNDAAVGRFLGNIGLMASGAGRVHGGARGGGSIQMVNYMKSLLSSSSTLDMFNGRLDSLDSYMKGYAAGPTTPKVKTKLDSAIDEILNGKK